MEDKIFRHSSHLVNVECKITKMETIGKKTDSFRFNIWFIYLRFCLFLERGREGEREEQKRQCVVASHAPPTGDLAHNAGMCPDREWNRQPFGLQADVQSTELQQPGLI